MEKQYDVIIAGTGIAGTCLGSILAKNVYGWGSADSRHVDFSLKALVGTLLTWGKTASPDDIRLHLFDFELPAA